MNSKGKLYSTLILKTGNASDNFYLYKGKFTKNFNKIYISQVSANVSGRGSPNISGRETPSSQVTDGDTAGDVPPRR